MQNKNLNDFIEQPRVKQFLRDKWVDNQVKQIVLSPNVSVEIKEALIKNPFQDKLIDDISYGRVR
jgi:hypothetical protein